MRGRRPPPGDPEPDEAAHRRLIDERETDAGMRLGDCGGRGLPAEVGLVTCVRATRSLSGRLMRLSAALLGTAALVISSGSACRASTAATPETAISELVASGHSAVRFRANDHGALRALRAVYATRDTSLWVADGQPTLAALTLIRTLQQADGYGLEPLDYDADDLATMAASAFGTGRALATGSRLDAVAAARNQALDAQSRVTFDVTLSAAALKLICDLHYGRIDPRAAGFDLGTPRPDDLDLSRELVALAQARDIRSQLAALEPRFLHYRLLEKTLPRYRLLAVSEPAASARVRKIELTLERWRWLPKFRTPPIIVNIPEFRLFAFRTTAVLAKEDGEVLFFNDLYGQDRRLERLLGLAPGGTRRSGSWSEVSDRGTRD